MPSITGVLAKFTNQNLVYWQKTGADTFGKPTYADPVEIRCRWEDRRSERLRPDGRFVATTAYILIGVPLIVGSLVFLGTLADWQALPTYPNLPTNLQGGREVMDLKTTPDIKAQGNVYEAFL
jgi:hypothetical protein